MASKCVFNRSPNYLQNLHSIFNSMKSIINEILVRSQKYIVYGNGKFIISLVFKFFKYQIHFSCILVICILFFDVPKYSTAYFRAVQCRVYAYAFAGGRVKKLSGAGGPGVEDSQWCDVWSCGTAWILHESTPFAEQPQPLRFLLTLRLE